MSAGRWTVVAICCSVISAAAGVAAGQFFIFPSRSYSVAHNASGAEFLPVAESGGDTHRQLRDGDPAALGEPSLDWQAANAWLPSDGAASPEFQGVRNASSFLDGELVPVDSAIVAPQTLVPPTDAAPIRGSGTPFSEVKPLEVKTTPKMPAQAEIQAIIRRVLPQIGKEELQILTEELDGRSRGEIEDFLQIRRQLRRELADSIPLLPNLQGLSLPGQGRKPVMNGKTDSPGLGSVVAGNADSVATMRLARAIAMHNQANVETVGFRRWVLRTEESVADPVTPQGISAQGIELDLSDGLMVATHRQLDVALRGAAFFRLRGDEQDAPFYLTRRGDFRVDSEGRLGIHCGDRFLALWPRVVIPQEAVGLFISPDGSIVTPGSEGAEPDTIGQLSWGGVSPLAELQPVGQGLISVTVPESVNLEAAISLNVLSSHVMAGHLELSNVDVGREHTRLNRIDAMLSQPELPE